MAVAAILNMSHCIYYTVNIGNFCGAILKGLLNRTLMLSDSRRKSVVQNIEMLCFILHRSEF